MVIWSLGSLYFNRENGISPINPLGVGLWGLIVGMGVDRIGVRTKEIAFVEVNHWIYVIN